MVNFKLDMVNFIHLKTQYDVIPITFLNVKDNLNLIEDSIEHFNSEIKWENMFTIDDALKRINNGMIMYIGMLDSNIFGHVWFEDCKDGRVLFNLFVRNQIQKKEYTGKEFVSDVIHRFEHKKPVYSEVDEWNEKSIKLFKKLGFQEF